MSDLPRPGVVGVLVRVALAVLVGFMALSAILDRAEFWDGFSDPLGSLGWLVPLALFTSWVVNELLQKAWRWRPTMAMLVGLAIVVAAGAMGGEPFGPIYGTYLWAWALVFSLLLGPAYLLAAVLRTPGCEMRSYADLWTRLRGGDPAIVACPGWIDRFDGVRLFGRF